MVVLSLDNPYATLGDISGDVSFGNVHDYAGARPPATPGWGGPGKPPCGDTRYGSIAFASCYARAATGRLPLMATESGWSTGPGVPEHVSEEMQANFAMQTVLQHFASGFARTYIYQLMDAGTDGGATMGLLRSDASPKPAMTALATLLRRLDDTQAGSGGDPGSADLAILANGAPVGEAELPRILLRHRDGHFTLVLWRPEATTDRRTVEVDIAALAAPPAACEIVLDSCAPLPATPGAGKLSLEVGPRPILVEFGLTSR